MSKKSKHSQDESVQDDHQREFEVEDHASLPEGAEIPAGAEPTLHDVMEELKEIKAMLVKQSGGGQSWRDQSGRTGKKK